MKNNIIEFLENKKILILGYGREGKSAYKFIKDNVLNYKLGIADRNEVLLDDIQISFYFGDNYLDAIKDYDIVIKSPGVVIKDYISDEEKTKITSLTDLFLRFCKNTIIGVTGTKGKSTTSSLIYHILKKCGFDTYLIGNIGIPCFDVIDDIKEDTVLVYELSCHQLEFVQASPNISILLNLYEEHLDHYVDVRAYVNAKTNIYKYQTKDDYLIYGNIYNYLDEKDLDGVVSQKINLLDNPQGIDYSKIKTSLIGEHNKQNIVTALLAVSILGVKEEEALQAVESFRGLEHRLEYVGTYKEISFYNDSIATAQEAVINAVKALKNVNTIIIGGMDRGLDYSTLIEFLSTSSVENIILLPSTNERIIKLFNSFTHNKHLYSVKNMEEAVKVSYKYTKRNQICLLSPAAASYGFYLNFEKRGEHFKQLVREYSNK